MSKKARFSIEPAPQRARPLSASRSDNSKRTMDCAAMEENELTIELLEERLTPGYPVRALKKTAGWGC